MPSLRWRPDRRLRCSCSPSRPRLRDPIGSPMQYGVRVLPKIWQARTVHSVRPSQQRLWRVLRVPPPPL